MGTARANFLTNGGFEQPPTATYTTISAGSGGLPGWTVGGNSVDVVNQAYFSGTRPAYEGSQFLDLAGTPGPGSISQSFASVAGQSYTLSFAYWFNAGATNYAFDVTAGGTTTTFTTTSAQPTWANASITFVATSSSSSVTFTQTVPPAGNQGALLDAVSVDNAVAVAAPVPATALAVVLGGGLLGFARRRVSR